MKGVCMVKGAVCGMYAPLYEIRPVNARVVHILLECILVYNGWALLTHF